jgi:hypothetical protein
MDVGKQFNVVTVSIDPTERPVLAEAKQALYTGLYGRPGRNGARLAFSYRGRTTNPAARERLGLSVCLRSGFKTVRPCQRNYDR